MGYKLEQVWKVHSVQYLLHFLDISEASLVKKRGRQGSSSACHRTGWGENFHRTLNYILFKSTEVLNLQWISQSCWNKFTYISKLSNLTLHSENWIFWLHTGICEMLYREYMKRNWKLLENISFMENTTWKAYFFINHVSTQLVVHFESLIYFRVSFFLIWKGFHLSCLS